MLSSLSNATQYTRPRDGAAHSGLDPLPSINHQDNPPKDKPAGKSQLGNPSVEALISTLGGVKFTVKPD